MSLLTETASYDELSRLAVELDGRPIPGLRMTEKEFEAWCTEDVKAEWVDGEVIVMAPVSGEHADINGWIYRLISDFVEHHEVGIVRGPEFIARFSAQRRRRCPDVMFIAKSRMRLLRPTYLDGAPDLTFEIVSPDSESRDWRDKYHDYETAGVREYWIVDPQSKKLEAYWLNRSKQFERLAEARGKVQSKVLRGFYLRPEWLWQSPIPKLALIEKELKLR
jgi:Uma2 family endonuclease